jgi:hypothetical protein
MGQRVLTCDILMDLHGLTWLTYSTLQDVHSIWVSMSNVDAEQYTKLSSSAVRVTPNVVLGRNWEV